MQLPSAADIHLRPRMAHIRMKIPPIPPPKASRAIALATIPPIKNLLSGPHASPCVKFLTALTMFHTLSPPLATYARKAIRNNNVVSIFPTTMLETFRGVI